MGKKKSRNTTTATYGWQTTPDTPDIIAARQAAQQGPDLSSPIISSYARAADDIQNQYFETDLPEAARGRAIAGQMFRLNQDRGTALSGAEAQRHGIKSGQLVSMAGLTAPRLTQTGGTAYGEQWGGIGQQFAGNLAGSAGSAIGS